MLAVRCARAAALAFSAAALWGCGESGEETGERWVFSNEDVDVALVQVFEQPAPDAGRLRHAVMCRSEATAARTHDEPDDVWPSWALVGYLPDVDKASALARAQTAALDAAHGAARDRLMVGDDWLAWQAATHVDFTFDDCVTWSRFELTDVVPPPDLDLSRAKRRCETGDCRRVALDLPGAMKIAHVEVDLPRVRFTVYSPALTYTGKRDIESRDSGRTWRVVR